MAKQSEKLLKRVAYHEAGHAVAACQLGLRFGQVTIKGDEAAHGRVVLSGRLDLSTSSVRVDTILKHLCVTLAGVTAEKKAMGRVGPDSFGYPREFGDRAVGDAAATGHLLEYIAGNDDEEARLFNKWARHRTERLIDQHWEWIESVANALLEQDSLTYDEVTDLSPMIQRYGRVL